MQGFQPLRHPSDRSTTRFLTCSPGYVRNGLDGHRTRCLLLARQALCRLSYEPTHCMVIPGEAKANYNARPNLCQRFAVPSPILSPRLPSFSSGVFFRLAPILFVVDAKPSESSVVFRIKERFTTSTLWTTPCAIQSTYVTRNHHAARNFSLRLPAHQGSIRLLCTLQSRLHIFCHEFGIKDVTSRRLVRCLLRSRLSFMLYGKMRFPNGLGGGTRTRDLLIPNQTRYLASLHPGANSSAYQRTGRQRQFPLNRRCFRGYVRAYSR